MSKKTVLDACIVVALLKKEEGANIVTDIFQRACQCFLSLYMNRVNLPEVYYKFFRESGERYALNILKNVEQSAVLISKIDKVLLLEAGRLKTTSKIFMADFVVVA